MAYKKEIILEARRMREDGFALGHIHKKLGVSKSTVFGWIKDIPVPKVNGVDIRTIARRKVIAKNSKAAHEEYRKKREAAYTEGWNNAPKDLSNLKIRDFVVLYIGEGYRKTKNTLDVTNTDPSIIKIVLDIFNMFSKNKISFVLRCRKKESKKLLDFWSEALNIDRSLITLFHRENGSERRSEFGVMKVRTNDTEFCFKVKGWIDWIKNQWI